MGAYARSEEYATALRAAGVEATTDPRNVTIPGVLFEPGELRGDLHAGWSADIQCLLLVPAPFNADAWAALDGLLAQVVEVLPVQTVSPTELQVDQQSGALPAFRLTFQEAV